MVDGCLDIDLRSILCEVVTDTVQVPGDVQCMSADCSTDHDHGPVEASDDEITVRFRLYVSITNYDPLK